MDLSGIGESGKALMDATADKEEFDRDVMSTTSNAASSQLNLREIITSIARASHDIADLVSLGGRAPLGGGADPSNRPARTESGAAAVARRILVDHLKKHDRVKQLCCVAEAEPIVLDEGGDYTVTIDPLEGMADSSANLPFGTIFSVLADDEPSGGGRVRAAGFIHYGPQTNLVFTLGAGVHIFNLDRAARTYRLAAESFRMPDKTREWSIDVTKRGRWPSSIRALIDEELGEADAPGNLRSCVRWTGCLTSDAYRILRHGGIYLCPMDDQPGQEDSCPNLRHSAQPVAFLIEQAGGRATTGSARVVDCVGENAAERTPMIFGSASAVDRVERLYALPETSFDSSPLFERRGLFRL